MNETRIPLRSGKTMVITEHPGAAYDTMGYSLETTSPRKPRRPAAPSRSRNSGNFAA